MNKELYNQINQIASVAFGDDLAIPLRTVREYKERAEACGCGRCYLDYRDIAIYYNEEWKREDEDLSMDLSDEYEFEHNL